MTVLVELFYFPSISYLVLIIFTNSNVEFFQIDYLLLTQLECLLHSAFQYMPQNLYLIKLYFSVFLYTFRISKQILSLFVTFITLWFKYQPQDIVHIFSLTQKRNHFTFWTFISCEFCFYVCIWTLQIYFISSESYFRSPK